MAYKKTVRKQQKGTKVRKASKPRRGYTADEKRAYWVGAGICAATYGEAEKLLNCSNVALRRSFQNGYEAENHKSISENLLKRKK